MRVVLTAQLEEVLTVPILITYVSPGGSTREIAEHIAARLRRDGHLVDCLPVHQGQAVAGYDTVVVGSAVHDQAWLPEAAAFVSTHAEELRAKAVWLYSVGMPGALARPLRRSAMREGPKVVAPFVDSVRPRDTHLFSGVVSASDFPLLSRVMLRLTGGHFGDFRDWADIDAWAASISRAVLASRQT